MSEESTKPKRLVVIDGKSVFYRGYYAMPNLSTKDGTPTGGVFGFATMALEVIRKLQPDYVCVAWDKSKTNIRKRLEMYPAYKAGRKPAPPDFKEQIPVLHELLDAFGWPLYELDDYEADDIMGTLAVQARKKGIDTALVTSDLDLLQVINGNVHVYALKKGLSNIELFHPESFKEKYGIDVDQFLDLKSIKGDSSDNIPGVPGIGEKGAVELLTEYKTLDGIYENIELIKDTLKKKLVAGKDSAYLSKKLAAIWLDAPIKLDLKEVDGSKCDPVKLQQKLVDLEFKSLARQLPDIMKMPEDLERAKSADLKLVESFVVDTPEKLDKLTLPKSQEIVIYGTSSRPHGQEPLTLSVSPDPKTVIRFDIAKLGVEVVGQKLKDYLEPAGLIGYDVKATLQILLSLGINAEKVGHDVLIGAFLINSLGRGLSLQDLAAEINVHLEEGELKDAEVIAVVRALWVKQEKELKKLPKVAKLAKTVEWPLTPVLARMEHTGIKLDTAYLKKMAKEIDDMISDITQQIYGHADQEFNISSPGQLAEVLFDKMELPSKGIKKGKTGYSTAATELAKLRGQHPIIDLISQYREVTKLKSTYVDTLPTQVDDNSRLHTTYALTVAQTGRLSSNDPNLQNIPIRTDLGKRIREAFIPDKGNVFVGADYSQFELRLAAYLSDDKDMMELFNKDVDVHVVTAAQVYGREPEDITKNMRRDAKVVNFGVMYGLGPHGLVEATGMNYGQAKEFIAKYFEVRPKLQKYIESVKEQAKNDGYVENLLGRRRPSPDVNSSNFMVREGAYRAAVNMPFQGTAADIMKLAMIAVDKKLDDNCLQLLQIHDSILVECPKDKADKVAKLLKATMEDVYKLPVKLTVDTTVGKTWGEL